MRKRAAGRACGDGQSRVVRRGGTDQAVANPGCVAAPALNLSLAQNIALRHENPALSEALDGLKLQLAQKDQDHAAKLAKIEGREEARMALDSSRLVWFHTHILVHQLSLYCCCCYCCAVEDTDYKISHRTNN